MQPIEKNRVELCRACCQRLYCLPLDVQVNALQCCCMPDLVLLGASLHSPEQVSLLSHEGCSVN